MSSHHAMWLTLRTMSLSGAYGAADESESLQVLQRAFDLGCTFWDSASVYGFGGNERLIGRFLESHPEARDKLFIASKCGWPVSRYMHATALMSEIENGQRGNLTNSASHIKQYIEDSTRRLGTAPDLYYLHRRDPNTPLAESIGALAELKQTGQCKYIGISEPSAATLREACKSEYCTPNLSGQSDSTQLPTLTQCKSSTLRGVRRQRITA